jgi:hypothetical protein
MSIPPDVHYLPMAAQNIQKGKACVVIDGIVTLATQANSAGRSPFVPIEDVDNSGGNAGDKVIGGVGPKQRVTVETTDALKPFDYVKISATTGKVMKFVSGTDDVDLIYGRYITKEGAVFSRDTNSPYAETLSGGQKPLLDAAANDVVVIELVDR